MARKNKTRAAPKRLKNGRFKPTKKKAPKPKPKKAAARRGQGRGGGARKRARSRRGRPGLAPRPLLFGKSYESKSDFHASVDPPTPGFDLYVHRKGYRLDATAAPPSAGRAAVPHYNQQAVRRGIARLFKSARNRAFRHGVAFKFWRVGVEFTQPADDGTTYLPNSVEIRTSPLAEREDIGGPNGWIAAFVQHFFDQSFYGEGSRVRQPRLEALRVEGVAGFKSDGRQRGVDDEDAPDEE